MQADNTVLVAAISSSASMLTAITTVIVVVVTQNRRFDDMGKRIDRLEHAVDVISSDLKEFYKELAHIKAKLGE